MRSRGLVLATRQMAELLAGGLTLARSLGIVAAQSPGTDLSAVLSAVRRDVAAGLPLSSALAARGDRFSPVYVGLIRAGESTGALAGAFDEIALHLEAEEEFRRRARNALAYPCLVLVAAAAVCAFLAGFVIPRFQALFNDLGQTLPLPTRLLLGAASAVRDHGPVVLAAGAAAVAAGWRRLPVRRWASSAMASAPVRRRLLPRFSERWARLMASLVRGGVTISSALALARRSLEPHPYASDLAAAERCVLNGLPLSQAIRKLGFPPMVADLLEAGEETGSLDSALERAARALGRQEAAELKMAMTFLEPALIAVMAGAVGFVALAMLLPIFDMSAGVR